MDCFYDIWGMDSTRYIERKAAKQNEVEMFYSTCPQQEGFDFAYAALNLTGMINHTASPEYILFNE